MSSDNRPWYKWWPKEFNSDEKVQCLSPIAELVYRRALDVMWQSNACHLPSNCLKLANALSKGLTEDQFKNAWGEIQTPGYELFKSTECGNWVYSSRLKKQMQEFEKIRKKRIDAGRKGGRSKR